jgi:ABC-2 type transport system permease protein
MTTTTLGMPAVAPISVGRLLYACLNEARYESLRMLRAPAFAIPFLVLPLVIYLLFSVMAVMGPAMFGMGITLAAERDAGLLKLKRAMPVPPGAYLLSKMLMSLFFATVAMALMTATAVFAGHLTLLPARLAAIINLIYLPMIWLSGLFIPLPGFLFMPAQMSAGVLLGITILFGGAAIRRLARTG